MQCSFPPIRHGCVLGQCTQNNREEDTRFRIAFAAREEIGSNLSTTLPPELAHGRPSPHGAPAKRILIGVPTYGDPNEITLPNILVMPFG
jgi:hypothetical protein